MRKKSLTLFCLLAVPALYLTSYAQVPSLNPVNGVVPAVFNTAGRSFDDPSSYHRYEWSFGEALLIQAFAPPDSSVLVTQGVLQPCTDVINKSPHTAIFTEGEYKLFPNPTTGKFELNFFVTLPGVMSLQLVNSLGQVLMSKSYNYDGCCRIELFDISRYPAGIYYVVADLKPHENRPGDNLSIRRHSGFKVIKLNDNP